MRKKQLPAGIYDTDICVIAGTFDTVSKYLKKHYDHHVDEWVVGRFFEKAPLSNKNPMRRIMFVMTDRCRKSEHHPVLMHEIVHCALSIFEGRGIRYSSKHSEPLAYFIEWLYKESREVLT
jgi:hypothetical protein